MDEELKETSAEELMLGIKEFSEACNDIPSEFRVHHVCSDFLSRLIERSKEE